MVLMLPLLLWLSVCVTDAVSLWLPEAEKVRVRVKLEDSDGDWLMAGMRLALGEGLLDCERV